MSCGEKSDRAWSSLTRSRMFGRIGDAGLDAAPPVSGGAASRPASPIRPNILLLVSDDQARSDFSPQLMPSVYSDLVDQGALFDRAYVNTSLCCPSRSQI